MSGLMPRTALDVTIQAQILELMKCLREELQMAILLITHDPGVVAEMADPVVVMYAGQVMEEAPAIPVPDPGLRRTRILLEGNVPGPADLPAGCRFFPRCRRAEEVCRHEEPPAVRVAAGHLVACHLARPELGLPVPGRGNG